MPIVAAAPNWSLPVKRASISAAAALNAPWPDMYSGNEGDTIVGSWYGNHSWPSIARVPWLGPPQAETCLPEYR